MLGLTELSTRNPLATTHGSTYQDEDNYEMDVDRLSQMTSEEDVYRDDKSKQLDRSSVFGGFNPAYFGNGGGKLQTS